MRFVKTRCLLFQNLERLVKDITKTTSLDLITMVTHARLQLHILNSLSTTPMTIKDAYVVSTEQAQLIFVLNRQK